MHKTAIILNYLILLLIPVTIAVTFPGLTDFVTDNANMISPEYEQKITEIAKQIEQNSTVEIAIVTIESLEGLSKEEYALELFEIAGIGKKDLDNGLLILVAKNEKQYRFEVGYGLEGIITDSKKVDIGTAIIEPNFKEGNFGEGIYSSLVIIQGLLNGQEEIISKYKSQYTTNNSSSIKVWIYIIIFILIILSSFSIRGRGLMFFPIFLPGPRWNSGAGGFGSPGFGNFGGGLSGGGGFGGSW